MFGRKYRELKETVRKLKCHVESLDFRNKAIYWPLEDLGYKLTDDAEWGRAEEFSTEPGTMTIVGSGHDKPPVRVRLAAIEKALEKLS